MPRIVSRAPARPLPEEVVYRRDDRDTAAVRRPRLWIELLVVAFLCWIYDDLTNLAPLRRAAASAHASSILHLESRLHIDPEAGLDHWLSHHHVLGTILSNYYDNAHFVITLGLVGWLWWSRPVLYRPLRNALVLTNIIGFAVFWLYPTAPPRLLNPGVFTDVVASTHAFGSWHAGTLATAANQLAAMPSLHIAWAAWSSYAVWRICEGRRWAAAVWIYPLLTSFAVMATGNHFLLDVVAGFVTFLVAMVAAEQWHERWNRSRQMQSALAGVDQLEPVAEAVVDVSPPDTGSFVGPSDFDAG